MNGNQKRSTACRYRYQTLTEITPATTVLAPNQAIDAVATPASALRTGKTAANTNPRCMLIW